MIDVDPSAAANVKLAIASGAGGLVRMFLRPAKSILQTVMLMTCCVICGFYFTHPLMRLLKLPMDPDYVGAAGALTGLLGLSLAQRALEATDGVNFRALIMTLIRGKTG